MRSAFIISALTQRKGRWRASVRVMASVGIAIGGVVFARLLGSVTQVVLARQMGLANFGLYTTLYTLLGPVVVVASLGLDTWLLRQGGNLATLDRAISEVFSLRLVAAAVFMVLGVVALLASGQPGLTLPLLVVAALGLTCELLLTTANTALRAQIRNRAAALLQVLVAGLLILLIWLFRNDDAPVLAVTWYRLIAGVVGVALLAWLLRRSLRLVRQPAHLLQVVKQARVYFVSDILANIGLKADLTMVALLMGAVAAGIYNPALTIINTTFIVPLVMWQVLLPIMAREQPGSRGLRLTLALDLAASLLYGLFWAVALLWGAGWIMHVIYGEQYRDAVPLLQIMSMIPLLKSINFCWATLMVARDRQVLRTKLQAVGSAVNGIGNMVCIPLFGLFGAAWVNVGTEIILLICYSYGAWITLRRRQ